MYYKNQNNRQKSVKPIDTDNTVDLKDLASEEGTPKSNSGSYAKPYFSNAFNSFNKYNLIFSSKSENSKNIESAVKELDLLLKRRSKIKETFNRFKSITPDFDQTIKLVFSCKLIALRKLLPKSAKRIKRIYFIRLRKLILVEHLIVKCFVHTIETRIIKNRLLWVCLTLGSIYLSQVDCFNGGSENRRINYQKLNQVIVGKCFRDRIILLRKWFNRWSDYILTSYERPATKLFVLYIVKVVSYTVRRYRRYSLRMIRNHIESDFINLLNQNQNHRCDLSSALKKSLRDHNIITSIDSGPGMYTPVNQAESQQLNDFYLEENPEDLSFGETKDYLEIKSECVTFPLDRTAYKLPLSYKILIHKVRSVYLPRVFTIFSSQISNMRFFSSTLPNLFKLQEFTSKITSVINYRNIIQSKSMQNIKLLWRKKLLKERVKIDQKIIQNSAEVNKQMEFFISRRRRHLNSIEMFFPLYRNSLKFLNSRFLNANRILSCMRFWNYLVNIDKEVKLDELGSLDYTNKILIAKYNHYNDLCKRAEYYIDQLRENSSNCGLCRDKMKDIETPIEENNLKRGNTNESDDEEDPNYINFLETQEKELRFKIQAMEENYKSELQEIQSEINVRLLI